MLKGSIARAIDYIGCQVWDRSGGQLVDCLDDSDKPPSPLSVMFALHLLNVRAGSTTKIRTLDVILLLVRCPNSLTISIGKGAAVTAYNRLFWSNVTFMEFMSS